MKVSTEDVFNLESLLQHISSNMKVFLQVTPFLPKLTIHLFVCLSFLLFTTEVFLPIKLKYCDRHSHKLTLNSTRKGKFHWGTTSVVFEHVESGRTDQGSEEVLLALPTPQQKQTKTKKPHLQHQQSNFRWLLQFTGEKQAGSIQMLKLWNNKQLISKVSNSCYTPAPPGRHPSSLH